MNKYQEQWLDIVGYEGLYQVSNKVMNGNISKYQEALDELNRMAYGDCMGDEHIARIYSRKILQELVDKETPLNLKLHHGVYMQCKCEAMNEVHNNYCWNCGQHIKLSETNE